MRADSAVESYQKYLDPQILAKLQGLDFKARLIVEGYVSGLHKSPYHGFSIEFAEHREYVSGDDLRFVDWKVFGKTDRFYLKQYEEETNFGCYLLVDTSASMRYKSDGAAMSKLDYAQHVAAALGYLILGAKARAMLHGRAYASTEDVRAVASPVLRHRIITNFNAEAEGVNADEIVRRLTEIIPQDAGRLSRGKLPEVFGSPDLS